MDIVRIVNGILVCLFVCFFFFFFEKSNVTLLTTK